MLIIVNIYIIRAIIYEIMFLENLIVTCKFIKIATLCGVDE